MKAITLSLLCLLLASTEPVQAQEPLRLAVARLTHGHVNWIFNRPDKKDVQVVGIYEPNVDLAQRYAERHKLSGDLFFTDLEEMLDAVEPEAVAAFGSIFEHLEVVEAAAPRGIHTMVEKPLAVSVEHAHRMKELADEHDVHVLTNYETTWYASVHEAKDVLRSGELGPPRKIVVRDGHQGPKEIGVSDEFLEWLTDPELNGGGAIIDFGCYGANLVTWLMNGALPETVTGVTQQIKPEVYPRVDDEATIVLTYPETQAIIQASWNWPFSRKDMHVYGRDGYVYAKDGTHLYVREPGERSENEHVLQPREAPFDDPFSHLAAVVRGDVEVTDNDLSSLSNNVTVVRILEAAKESAASGRTVSLAKN